MQRYFDFIQSCRETPQVSDLLETHHIIPKSEWPGAKDVRDDPKALSRWLKTSGVNDPSNMIVLTYENHIRAHVIYYEETGRCHFAVHSMLNGLSASFRKMSTERQDELLAIFARERAEALRLYGLKQRNSRWFNDGEQEFLVHPDDADPEWRSGRLPNTQAKRDAISNGLKGLAWYHDENGKNAFVTHEEAVARCLVRGRILSKSHRENVIRAAKEPQSEERRLRQSVRVSGTAWYNDGVRCIRVKDDQPVPEGFTPGRIRKSASKRSDPGLDLG